MSKVPAKSKVKSADAETETSPSPRTYKITPNTPSEFIDAGYSLAHISDDGLVYVLKKGHSLVRIACELVQEPKGAARLVVRSAAKVP